MSLLKRYDRMCKKLAAVCGASVILTFHVCNALAQSAEEIAKELANPNTALATLTLKNQFRTFEGDLPNADDQDSFIMLFQPALPFVREDGSKIIFRPAIPFSKDQPLFNPGLADFDEESGLGDIVFDLAYAPVVEPGTIVAYGIISSLPTGEDELTSDRWTLGPEFLYGKITEKYVAAIFPNHQWDVGGSGDKDISLTTIQPIYTYLPGGGWSVGTGPSITYDWESEEWTVPVQFNFGKTITIGARPWKLSAEINYYADKPDAFGPEWMVGFNIGPVVRNGLADWFK